MVYGEQMILYINYKSCRKSCANYGSVSVDGSYETRITITSDVPTPVESLYKEIMHQLLAS